MESIYLVILVLLFLFAISDLVIGVSNDAVNFLNSAVGSKAASFRTIMIIAGIGIIVGASFSNGMMEVARKGIFNPNMYFFSEIMIIFLAVMMTDIVLLDLFNTFSLPTSTTVSIVFELMGAAVAIALIKVLNTPEGEISEFINNSKALAIVSGILLSIIVAFTLGAIIQYIARLLFSFNYQKTYKYFGSVFGGIAITSIIYFLLVKGAKGSSLIDDALLSWIKTNTRLILLYSFIIWTAILQIVIWLFKANIFKFIVLVGTFTLAMAFAGNDLVNFIGVPLAGLSSYKAFLANGVDPALYEMGALNNPVKTPTYLLLLAGVIMTITLWVSRKARSVTKTTIDLSRQYEGAERFQSSIVARIIVRLFVYIGNIFKFIIPKPITAWINKRLDPTRANHTNKKSRVSFDLVRASVILFVASIIIAFATSLKLPLSTTYVTFMVAMGASLSDRAWDRESAVYRVTGVLVVVSGWFFTAFSAFSVAFIVALLIHWGGIYAIAILVVLAALIIIRTHLFFHKKDNTDKEALKEDEDSEIITEQKLINISREEVVQLFVKIPAYYNDMIFGHKKEKIKILNKIKKKLEKSEKINKKKKENLYKTISKVDEKLIQDTYLYVMVVENITDTLSALNAVLKTIYKHTDNNHKPLLKEQTDKLYNLAEGIKNLCDLIRDILDNEQFDKIDIIFHEKQKLIDTINEMRINHTCLTREENISNRNCMLFFNILSTTETLVNNINSMSVSIIKLVNINKKDIIQQIYNLHP